MMVEQWNMVPLHQLPIKIIDGDRSSRYPKRNEFQSVGVPFLNSTNIVENRLSIAGCNLISEEKYESIRKGRVMHGDIIMTTRGSIGKIAIAHRRRIDRAIINAQMLLLRSDEVTVHSQFLFYVMCSDEFQMEMRNFASGSAQPQIPITDLKHVSIPLPPFNTQRKIAAILSAYDDLIENNLRRIKILEEMAQNLYREWFVKFRFPGYEKLKFVDSPLGMIPEGWDISTIENAFEITGGGTPSKKEAAFWDAGTVNWYSPTDLTATNSMFIESSRYKITNLGLKKSSARLFPAFSVMMTSRATLGVISINTTDACTNQGFITCLPNDRVPLYFLYHWLSNNVEMFTSLATGATFKEITKGVFKKIELAIPPSTLITQFEEAVRPLGETNLNLLRRNILLRKTRDLLLPKLVSGEVDVSDLDIKIPEEVIE